MPIKSKAQQRAMYAAASGKGKTGIPKDVAEEFIEATPKSAYKRMPERKRRMIGKRKK
jgi:hypothetical protein